MSALTLDLRNQIFDLLSRKRPEQHPAVYQLGDWFVAGFWSETKGPIGGQLRVGKKMVRVIAVEISWETLMLAVTEWSAEQDKVEKTWDVRIVDKGSSPRK